MTLLGWLIGLLLVLGGLFALLYAGQRLLLYHPTRTRTPPARARFPVAQEITLGTSDGERLIGWHVPARPEKPVVLYFHGNAGTLAYRVDRFRALVADGLGLIAISYRGYGGSTGRPSEAGLIADAEA